MDKKITIYTDGAAKGNPGKAGWGAIIMHNGKVFELGGRKDHATNNQMELTAPIEALKYVKNNVSDSLHIEIHSDSKYVILGITEWIHGWIQNGWRTSQHKPVKNQDLWELLYNVAKLHTITWHWVRGHAGHPENERADFLARHAIIQTYMGGNNGGNQSSAKA